MTLCGMFKSVDCRLHTEKRLLNGVRNILLKFVSPFRLAVLGKLNNFVKEWIAEISELKVCSKSDKQFIC